MMKSKYAKFAKKGMLLHKLLNSEKCPSDIGMQYEQQYAEARKMFDTDDVLKHPAGIIALHDSAFRNLSERKIFNSYVTTFDTVFFVREENGRGIGYLPAKFEIKSRNTYRELNKKNIYDFKINSQDKTIVCTYWKNWSLCYKVFTYDELNVQYLDFVSY